MGKPYKNPEKSPESYSPKKKPILLRMMESVNKLETKVKTVNERCAIVERAEMRMVGISIPITFESQGYPLAQNTDSNALNDALAAEKYIGDGTIAFLAQTLDVQLGETEIISARYDGQGDGTYRVLIGFALDADTKLPEFLPEHTQTLTLPACRYAKMEINAKNQAGRVGFSERMQADDYFIGGFREDSGYIFNTAGIPMNIWSESGEILRKYEPVHKPKSKTDGMDTFTITPVLLPPWQMACCTHPHGDTEYQCILDYFEAAPKVYQTGLARYDQVDFYGFPVDFENSCKSCFGSRVSSFAGLPDCVEKITLPGGKYLHITQKEFNGDNPSMPYDIAFNHLDELYFADHPEYEFDSSRKVIARFRQSNCASVFAPVRKK